MSKKGETMFKTTKRSIVFLLASIFSLSFIQANDFSEVEKLSPKSIVANKKGFIILSDQSFWKVTAFSARSQNWSEWWNATQLIPANCECNPSNWTFGTQIEIYSKSCELEIDDSNASNKKTLRNCSHLFFNPETETILFAVPLDPKDFASQLYQEGFSKGHAAGLIQGSAMHMR